MKKAKKLMTVAEREALSATIESDQSFRDQVASGELAPGIMGPIQEGKVNLDSLDASIRHKKQILSQGTPERLSGSKRAEAEKRYNDIGGELSERLLTHKEMDLMPKHGYEYHRAVRKSVAKEVGNSQTQAMMNEWRSLGAQLDPENPEAQSVDSLRKLT